MRVRRGVITLAVLVTVVVVWMVVLVLGVIPTKKTVREPIGRPVTAEMSSEKLRKKAEETTLFLLDWLKGREKMDKVLAYHKGGRDPFLPAIKKKEKEDLAVQLPKLVLKGIAWDETEPLALINDLIVKEGDTIQEAKIVKIDFDQVAIRYYSKEFVIKLIEWEKEVLGETTK